mmetsp:Transcript_74132/g.143448  ORF Transcript_74132/g.143448 Transcript_74132/m.143448 type:complete len:93 (-) Transcript_74132:1197-1475(-)
MPSSNCDGSGCSGKGGKMSRLANVSMPIPTTHVALPERTLHLPVHVEVQFFFALVVVHAVVVRQPPRNSERHADGLLFRDARCCNKHWDFEE